MRAAYPRAGDPDVTGSGPVSGRGRAALPADAGSPLAEGGAGGAALLAARFRRSPAWLVSAVPASGGPAGLPVLAGAGTPSSLASGRGCCGLVSWRPGPVIVAA